jgi:hypothetical protein
VIQILNDFYSNDVVVVVVDEDDDDEIYLNIDNVVHNIIFYKYIYKNYY